MTCSVWMVIVITAARYFAISDPLRNKRTSSPKLARSICASVSALSLIYNCPTFFELYLMPCKREVSVSDNITVLRLGYAIDGTDLRLNAHYILIFRVVMNIMFVSLVPFIVIAALTLRLITLIRKSSSEQFALTQRANPVGGTTCNSNSRNSGLIERHITIMLVVLLIKFLLCYTLPTLINILELANKQARYSFTFSCLTDIGNLLVVINSATNFLVYFRCRHNLRRTSINKKNGKEVGCESSFVSAAPDVDNGRKAEKQRLLNASPIHPRHTFHYPQIIILQKSWNALKQKHDNMNLLGSEVIAQVIKGDPTHGRVFKFDACDMNEEALCQNPEIMRHSCLMHKFIDDLIADYSLPPSPINQVSVRTTERAFNVGMKHRRAGVNLNNMVYVTYKRYMLKKLLNTQQTYEQLCALDHTQPEAVVWNRFLSFIISDMKLGYTSIQGIPSSVSEINIQL